MASGILKLRDPSWPEAARAFGAPGPTIAPLPYVELVLGVLLGAQLRLAALAALVLLAAFTTRIVVHLARGDRVPGACFGRPKPVSPSDLVRNLALIGLAVVGLL